MKRILPILILLASTIAPAFAATHEPAAPAPPTFSAPSGIAGAAAAPLSTQHYNSFTFGASADSTSTNPGTTNLYRAAGQCSANVQLTSFTQLQTGNPPSAASAAPVYDTGVKAGDVFSYVVTAVIGGVESGPSKCVTGTTPTFSVGSLAVTSN